MRKQSTVVITAGIPRQLRDSLARAAEENMGSMASEVRRALVRHVEERASSAGTPAPDDGAVEAGSSARAEAS